MTAVVLTVEFLPDGRCVLDAPAATLRPGGDLTRTIPPGGDVARPLQPSDSRTPFRCPLPYAALGHQPIELRVVLPSGAGRPDDVFPRVEWRQSGHDWIGTATLPSAPSFVSLGQAPALPTRESFGWNFYGFFVFATVFIALYFAWAWWIQRRTPASTP